MQPSWPLPEAIALRDRLWSAYAEPSRGYHDTLHLTEVCARLDELAEAGEPFASLPVRLAAWFHDAVYDGAPEAEERSALWAEEALTVAGLPRQVIDEVTRLVRLTVGHLPGPDDPNGAALCDADLAILASDPARYRAYLAGVRQEYRHLPDSVFDPGRAAVVRSLLNHRQLFHTATGRARWERSARANLAAELASGLPPSEPRWAGPGGA